MRNRDQIPDTTISHHRERLEVQANTEPVSECLATPCPLVDTSSLAPMGRPVLRTRVAELDMTEVS